VYELRRKGLSSPSSSRELLKHTLGSLDSVGKSGPIQSETSDMQQRRDRNLHAAETEALEMGLRSTAAHPLDSVLVL
jgi:hypothetical protein